MPRTIQELFDRKDYPLMNEYKDVYERIIKPRVSDIIKDSKAKLEVPTLKYNDIGLGTFDFAKASLGLQPLYKYYALKHKRYVEGSEVYVKKENNKFRNFLKSDNSDVVIVPWLKEGYEDSVVHEACSDIHKGDNIYDVLKKYNLKIGKFTSSIKKTYLYKENVPKPLNAVRVFVFPWVYGIQDAEAYKWTGYAAIGICELLTAMGYNVAIHGISGAANSQINYENGTFDRGVRLNCITLKPFSETIHSQRLLYVLSDPSFLRGKVFLNLIKQAQDYNDYMDSLLGFAETVDNVKSIVYKGFGAIDKQWNKDGSHNLNSGMLYYILGRIGDEQEMAEAILNLGLNVVNENATARAQVGLVTQP
jgi:hypothetical protein